MTQAELRRAYPRLIRMVERSAHSKFKRKPTLVFAERKRPQNECARIRRGKTVVRVAKARIFIPKRMARENLVLAKLAVCHELRGVLAFQNGNSAPKSHRIAVQDEKTFRNKLGIGKSGGWLLRSYYRS